MPDRATPSTHLDPRPLLPPDEYWCSFCGVNATIVGALCSSCQADEDFYNCTFCQGTSCTGACDDEEDLT